MWAPKGSGTGQVTWPHVVDYLYTNVGDSTLVTPINFNLKERERNGVVEKPSSTPEVNYSSVSTSKMCVP